MNFDLKVNDEGEGSITFVTDGALVTVPHTHPNFKRISHALVAGNDPTEYLNIFQALDGSDRVTVGDDVIYFDGEPIHDNLTRTILRYKGEGRDTANLVRFLERLQANPSRRSREQLWSWISDRDLTVDDEGRIVAWKAVETVTEWVEVDNGEGGIEEYPGRVSYRSISSGTAWVNGAEHQGKIPYAIGDEVTIPREQVQDDPGIGCSHGLHVGSFSYASGFAPRDGAILEVAVAPEDVVSVPKDSNHEKLRCSKFVVLDVQDVPTPDLSRYEPEGDDWDDTEFEEIVAPLVPETFLGRLFGRLRGETV
jgi:hypothetical protein